MNTSNNYIIHSIAAISEKNRVIGDTSSNSMLWHISDDFKRFKRLTMGHPIIMGSKTYDSIGKALPGRTNIVLSRERKEYPDAISVTSLDEALEKAKESEGSEDVFIIGGGQIYTLTLPLVDILHLTLVHKDYEGDVLFPDYSEFKTEISREEHLDEPIPYTFVDLKK